MRKPAVARTTRPNQSRIWSQHRAYWEPTRKPSIEARVMLSFARAAGHPGFGLLGKAIANRYADFCRLASGAFVLHIAGPIAAHASQSWIRCFSGDVRNFPI
jgi:hypothetical protein